MTNNLMKISELAELLEYTDLRSVVKWCNKNRILIAPLGKAKYVLVSQINKFFEDRFNGFAFKYYQNAEQIIDANANDDKLGLVESMKAPTEKCVKKKYKAKIERSKASQEFLNNLKSA